MFENIPFERNKTASPLIWKPPADVQDTYPDDTVENMMHTNCWISCEVDVFRLPLIPEETRKTMLYTQAANVFHYHDGSYIRRQSLDSLLVLYTYAGSGIVEYEEKKYALGPGDGVFLDCRKPHLHQAQGNWSTLVMHIKGGLAYQIQAAFEQSGSVLFHEAFTGEFQQRLERMMHIYSTPSLHRDLYAAHCIEGLLLHLLGGSVSVKPLKADYPSFVRDAQSYIDAHFAEPITLDLLAELTNTNKYHLSKKFRQYTGFAPHDYLIWQRINHAKFLLRTTTLPAAKIAHEVGIHDINNFNYLFKKKLGQTPIRYRNSADILNWD